MSRANHPKGIVRGQSSRYANRPSSLYLQNGKLDIESIISKAIETNSGKVKVYTKEEIAEFEKSRR
jgi:hypothetical protein